MNTVTMLPPRRRLALSVPVVLLAALALPFLPLLALGLVVVTDRPLRAVGGLWRLLIALGGTVIEVDSPDAIVAIRLF